MKGASCYADLKQVQKDWGYSQYDHDVKRINRERVNPERGKKIDYTWAQVKRAYKKQRGICPVCTHDMPLIREKLHGDHWDCNLTEAEGLNSEKNCAATHKDCNLHKSTKSPADLSKLRQLNPTMGMEDKETTRAPIEEEI